MNWFKKSWILLILIFFLLCYYVIFNARKDIIQFAIVPPREYSECYYYRVNDKGVLFCEVGTHVTGAIITDKNFIVKKYDFPYSKYQYKEKKLTKMEFDTLKEYLSQLRMNDYVSDYSTIDDSWELQILYDDKFIKQWYTEPIYSELGVLRDFFIKISPFHVNIKKF
ncbi:MAG: hypothetical protein E7411_04865 [Ruminococcaceae bacterium]|nr:hypothetical protein [Oscillospiraceae bacterium]